MSICKTFSLLLPSHNCIIIHNVQFSRCNRISFLKRLNETSLLKMLQSISFFLVEISGFEPLTSCLQGRRSPSWAKPPYLKALGQNGLALSSKWWAKMDSNHRPHDYQSCALASWAIGPYWSFSSCSGTFLSVPSKLNNVNLFLHPVLTLGHCK